MFCWSYGGGSEAFCHSDESPVDVIDDFALLIEGTLQGLCAGLCPLELLAEILIGLLEILAKTGLAAKSLADHEAEGGR